MKKWTNAELEEKILDVVAKQQQATSPPPSIEKVYGAKEIVAELNRRTGTTVSVKHGMRWLRDRKARLELSDRPGARVSITMSEFDRLGLPRPPKTPK
jgi:hypothetical protein